MFQPNSVIAGRYQVIRLVGQGGMSNLYLAYDRKYANATVVIKEMTASYSDPKEQQMAVDLFHREAKLLASLNHRHIPKVFDYFQFAGKYYLSMEFIDGVDLAVKLEESKGPLPEQQVLEWGEQMATVLFYLHMHDPPIVFRDVKPSNIMLTDDGVKLIDFGIARHFDQAKKGDTMRIGSPGYAPPEQYAAQTDPRSDIYALGVTLHHALTGRDPTATSTPFLVPPARKLNPKLSEATAAMLARATQLDPSDRYQSALELKKDIKHILQRNGQSTRVVGAPPVLPTAAPVSAAGEPATSSAPANATSTSAPAVATSSPANPAVASSSPAPNNPAPHQSASGSLIAASTPSGALPPAATASQGLSKAKKRFPLGKLLLASCLILSMAGLFYLSRLAPETRAAWLADARSQIESFMADLQKKQSPEDKLRESLLAGRPEALLPLFQSSDFKELSEEKQELYRLNLLAAGSAQGNLRIVHLLVPEGQDDENLWRVCALALGAINGSGGVAEKLFAIAPQTYKPGRLAALLRSSTSDSQGSLSESFLVIGAKSEALPEQLPAGTLFLEKSQTADNSKLDPLTGLETDYDKIFGLRLDTSSAPSVWGIPGPIPKLALESKTPVRERPDKTELSDMMEQAQDSGGRLVLLARDGETLSEIGAKGKLLILAVTPEQLPKLAAEQEALAFVLSSPFEQASRDAVHLRPPSFEEPLSLSEARLFDAILLAALDSKLAFSGLTINRNSEKQFSAKSPTVYRWNQNSWLPQPEEEGKKE